jgi:hypothetical protein
MSSWETAGKSDDWMTPRYVFDALGDTFDMDVGARGERAVRRCGLGVVVRPI